MELVASVAENSISRVNSGLDVSIATKIGEFVENFKSILAGKICQNEGEEREND
jgi:hypothetical protein